MKYAHRILFILYIGFMMGSIMSFQNKPHDCTDGNWTTQELLKVAIGVASCFIVGFLAGRESKE